MNYITVKHVNNTKSYCIVPINLSPIYMLSFYQNLYLTILVSVVSLCHIFCFIFLFPTDDNCRDKFSYCPMVAQARLCRYSYYNKACCFSCYNRGRRWSSTWRVASSLQQESQALFIYHVRVTNSHLSTRD